jgi:hypothetical protein
VCRMIRMNLGKNIVIFFVIYFSVLAHAETPRSIAQSLWEDVRLLKGIPSIVGLKNAELYVFFDPNCYVCAELFDLSKISDPSEKAASAKSHALNIVGNMPQALWIPVFQMKDSSRDMSAALLRSGIFQDIIKNYEEFNFEKLEGATKSVVPTDRELASLAQAKNIWKRLGGGTPLFVYRDKTGDFKRFIGIPSKAQLTSIFDSVNTGIK